MNPSTWQVYPHWLDGEFVRITSNASGPEQHVLDFVRALKLHALLGTRFVLNDVQVFDSAVLLELFADDDFLEFVKKDRDLFDLRVEPESSLGTSPFGLAARGLARTGNPGWLSSVFVQDPTPIRRLAEEIISNIQQSGHYDVARPSPVLQEFPRHRRLLQGARNAVHYFGTHDAPQRLVAPAGPRTNYWEVLEKWSNRVTEERDRSRMIEVLEFIRQAVPDEGARKARSSVRAVLDTKRDPRLEQRIWSPVVQAWNYATQETLRPDGGSVGNLSGVGSPAQDIDQRRDIVVPIDSEVLEHARRSPEAAHFPIDLDDISWGKIREARAETMATRLELSKERWIGRPEVVRGPLRKHLEQVSRIVHSSQSVSGVSYGVILGAAAGQYTGALIEVIVGGTPGPLTQAGSAAAGAAVGQKVEDLVRNIKPWALRRALTSTLMDAALPKST